MRIFDYHVLDANGDSYCGMPVDPDGYERLGEPDENTCQACLRKLAMALQQEVWELSAQVNNLTLQVAELKEAKIEAADILEALGEMAWGIDLPELRVTLLDTPAPTVVPKAFAQQVVERVYRKLKTGRRFLEQERKARQAAEQELGRLKRRLGESEGP